MLDGLVLPPSLGAALALALPVAYGLAALGASRYGAAERAWRRAHAAAVAALVAALALGAAVAMGGDRIVSLASLVPWNGLFEVAPSLRIDALAAVMSGLVAFIGLVILRFSRRYLDGDPGQVRFVRWFAATLASVTLLVVANHLLLIVACWIATSLSLHQLLLYYPERRPAQLVAHKKFLASRVADLCLFGAALAIGWQVGSLELDQLSRYVAAQPELPSALELAAVLLALGAILKCAQLPFHGWLIQVMEAPTPVSALLHAGVVNLGGFLMIRTSALLAEAELAQTLLVVVGTATAVLASLVMTTRVSIKVMLAWSTCAQMGFMLLQCGLGAYTLALLHLVAHSLYKAHAFLCAGSVVDQWRAQAILRKGEPAPLGTWLVAPALGVASVAAIAAAFGADPRQEPALWVAGWIVCLALAPLLTPSLRGGARQLALCGGASLVVVALYFAGHALFSAVLPPRASADPSSVRLAIPIAGFALLYALTAMLSAHPRGRLAAWLFPRLFAGFHLDELFTRLTFRLWPVQPRAEHSPAPAVATRSHS
jgi:NAD(P)H-quinone oxidoreductase subunit 5